MSGNPSYYYQDADLNFPALEDECPAGYETKSGGACGQCEVNMYKPFQASAACLQCPESTDTQNRKGAMECGKSTVSRVYRYTEQNRSHGMW